MNRVGRVPHSSRQVRPGRFDRHIAVPLPDVKGRTEILELYLSKIKCYEGKKGSKRAGTKKTADGTGNGKDVDVEIPNASVLARGTPGVSGADLANIVNSAGTRVLCFVIDAN